MSPTDELSTELSGGHRYLEDGGFTTRTMERLPPPARPRRRLVLGASFALSLLTLSLVLPALLERLRGRWSGPALTAAVDAAVGLVPLLGFAALVAIALVVTLTRDRVS